MVEGRKETKKIRKGFEGRRVVGGGWGGKQGRCTKQRERGVGVVLRAA